MSQLLHMQFRGLDEGVDPKTAEPGTLLKADNCRMDKARRLHKRWAMQRHTHALLAGGALASGARLFEAGDGGYGMTDGTSAYVFHSGDGNAWQAIDRVAHLNATKRPLVDGAKGAVGVDCTLAGTRLVTIWMASDPQYAGGGSTTNVPIYCQVQDVETWAVIVPPTLVATSGLYPRAAAIGTDVGLFYTNSSGEIRCRMLDVTTNTLGTDTAIVTGLVASQVFDVHVASSKFYVVGVLAAGANRMRVQAFTSALASSIGPTTFGGAVAGLRSVSINVTASENCYVAYGLSAASEVYLATLSAAALAVTAGPTLKASVAAFQCFALRDSATTLLFGYGGGSSTTGFVTMEVNGSTHATTANTTRTTFRVANATRPWKVNSRWYCSLMTEASDKNAVRAGTSRVVVEIRLDAYAAATATHLHVGTLENQTGTQFQRDGTRWNSSGGVVSGATVYLPVPYTRELTEIGTALVQGASLVVLTETGDRFRPLRAGNTTLFVSAAPSRFDGLAARPYGFIHPPQISATAKTGAAGNLAAGDYQYAACFVRIGADGILERSAMSTTVSVTGVSLNDSVTLTFNTTGLSSHLDENTGFSNVACPTYIEIYRTEVGGSILYRLTRLPLYNSAINTPLAATVTFEDTRADSDVGDSSDLAAQPQPYTASELDDDPPPAATTGVVHRNRFFLIASDEFTVAASKDASEDIAIAPGFNQALTLSFASRKKALASLDEKLVAMGEDDIDIVHGNGPDSNGDANDWQIQRLQTDVGCVNPRSVVVTPMGVVFESRRGLELLDRGLSVTPIGTAIEDTLDDYPVITSAVLVADESEVRFTCNAEDGATGVVIVWDYLNKFWCVRRYLDLDELTADPPLADAAIIGGAYAILLTVGKVYYEDKTTHLDGNSEYIARDVQLAWVSPGGPNAWHRFRRWQVLGTNVSNHDLKMSVARDYATSWFYDNTFAAQTTPTTVGPIQQARVHPTYQKGTAQRLRLQDLEPTTGTVGSGAGPIWEAVTLEFDVKRSTARTSAAEQA